MQFRIIYYFATIIVTNFLFMNRMLKMKRMVANMIPATARTSHTTVIETWIPFSTFKGVPSDGTPPALCGHKKVLPYYTTIQKLIPTWPNACITLVVYVGESVVIVNANEGKHCSCQSNDLPTILLKVHFLLHAGSKFIKFYIALLVFI